MVRIRQEDVEDLDVDELDALEYSTEQFDSYDGEVPPKDITLTGYVKRMWWTRSGGGDPMLKILWVAEDNEGDTEEYNGCPFWLNYSLIGGAKFRWAPFFDTYGITLRQIKKREIDLQEKDDQNGAPINKIGSFRPGEENDEAWCRIVTGSERWNGEYKPAISSWLPYDSDEADESDEADDEPEDEEDEEPDDDVEPEPEPEPAPVRGRGRAAARSAPVKAEAPPARRGARAAASKPEQPAPARAGRGTKPAARSAPAKAAAAKPAARGRGRRSSDGYADDPPF
jgi:hypothetical protein